MADWFLGERRCAGAAWDHGWTEQTRASNIEVVPPINPVRGGDRFPGPGAGMYPTRGGFGNGGDDMLIGPNDLRWGTGVNPSSPGALPGVPPGRRFDPYGPPGVPGFEPNRFMRDRRSLGGRHHPDLEQPGSDPPYFFF